jgi:hypothetical protein
MSSDAASLIQHGSPADDGAESVAWLQEAVDRIVDGEPLDDFASWLQARLEAEQGASSDARFSLALARYLWSHVPVPQARWRARPLPKPERNAPCYCGSGRKFKQCCAEFAALRPPLEDEQLFAMALDAAEPSDLAVAQLRLVPPLALAQAAFWWNDGGEADRTVQVVEPLFVEAGRELDERYEPLLDALLDALAQQGLDLRRLRLIDYVASLPNAALACTARCRKVTMLADRGRHAEAWAEFREAARLYPDDAQLWHLEVLTLLDEGREDEGRSRAAALAQRARREGYDDLAKVLERLAREGRAGLDAMMDETEQQPPPQPTPQDLAFVALADAAPLEFDAERARALQQVERERVGEGEEAREDWMFSPGAALQPIEAAFAERFPVEPPLHTELWVDTSGVLDRLDEVQAFLREHPEGWLSPVIVDTLLLAANDLDAGELDLTLAAARRLAGHGLALLQALTQPPGDEPQPGDESVPPLRIEWAWAGNRPLLRLAVHAIEWALEDGDEASAEQWMQWLLARNPHDNHGYRHALVLRWLQTERAGDALALLERYDDGEPESELDRALALFLLERRDEARAAVEAVQRREPRYLEQLLADWVDRPADPAPDEPPSPALQRERRIYDYRDDTRALWQRSGALGWLAALELKPASGVDALAARFVRAPRRRSSSEAGAGRERRPSRLN